MTKHFCKSLWIRASDKCCKYECECDSLFLQEPASGPVLSPAPLKRTSLHLFDYSSKTERLAALTHISFTTSVCVHCVCTCLGFRCVILLLSLFQGWDNNSGMLVWQKFPEGNITQHIEVEHDGNYFLYLQLTLQSTNTGVNYLIEVKRVLEGDQHDVILKRHINKSENSTGLMGKGLLLSAGTNVHVTCKPATQFSKQDTYLGMIKL
uniref:TNF family profile domain-containing protein n=1 Tax=Electrophorus electricus TaxID=8005 RepID=A0A4W4ES88_ELEEL